MHTPQRCVQSGLVGIVVWLLGLIASAQAQVPERFRLDFGMVLFSGSETRGFMGGPEAPRAGLIGPTDFLGLFEVAGTLNLTERFSLAAGLPFGVVSKPEETDIGGGVSVPTEELTFGLGDVHAEMGYQLLRQGRFLPGLHVQVEAGAPTAKFAGLGTGLWRVTGKAQVSKALHPTFSIFASGGYSHFFEKDGIDPGPIVSYGGGVGLGLSRSVLLTIQGEEVAGGEIKEAGQVTVPFTRDLRLGLGLTFFSAGRPRTTLLFAVGGLRDQPTFTLAVKWVVLSL
jgi:hypothetical protein